jgi:hypothetical protein
LVAYGAIQTCFLTDVLAWFFHGPGGRGHHVLDFQIFNDDHRVAVARDLLKVFAENLRACWQSFGGAWLLCL